MAIAPRAARWSPEYAKTVATDDRFWVNHAVPMIVETPSTSRWTSTCCLLTTPYPFGELLVGTHPAEVGLPRVCGFDNAIGNAERLRDGKEDVVTHGLAVLEPA